MNFEFMTIDTPLPPCMPFPRALLGFPVSSTAKVMYCRMLDAMLSDGQEDENGILFVCFPVTAIAAALSRSSMTVKRSLNELETAGLIMRVRRSIGEPNRIYVLTPREDEDVSSWVRLKALNAVERKSNVTAKVRWEAAVSFCVNAKSGSGFFSEVPWGVAKKPKKLKGAIEERARFSFFGQEYRGRSPFVHGYRVAQSPGDLGIAWTEAERRCNIPVQVKGGSLAQLSGVAPLSTGYYLAQKCSKEAASLPLPLRGKS